MKKYFALLGFFIISISLQASGYHTGVTSPKQVYPERPSVYPTTHHPEDVLVYHDMDVDCDGDDDETTRTGEENWTVINPSSFVNGTLTIIACGNYALSDCIALGAATSTDNILIDADNVVLDLSGHTINGASNTTATGIRINGKNNVTIRNGHITGTTASSIDIDASSNNIRIENMTITNPANGIDAITIDTAGYGVWLKNITIVNDSNTTGQGIVVSTTCQGFTLDGFKIAGIDGSGKCAINLAANADGIIIKNGTITDIAGGTTSHGIKLTGNHGVVIENVEMTNVTGDGINGLTNANLDVIMRNINITGPTLSGIDFDAASNGLIFENITVTNPGTTGITVSGASEGVVMRNIDINNFGTAGASVGLFIEDGSLGAVIDGVRVNGGQGVGIQTGAVVGLSINNFMISDPTTLGIDVNGAALNVRLTNGTIASTTTGINVANTVNNYHIENVNISNSSANGITFGTGAQGVTLKNCHISVTGTTGIAFGNTGDNITISDSTVSACVNGITIGNSCGGITIDNFVISKPTTSGMTFGTATYGLTLRNGAIAGTTSTDGPAISVASLSNGIEFDSVNVEGSDFGVIFEGLIDGANNSRISDITIRNCKFSGHLAASTYGIKFIRSKGILMENCLVADCFNVTDASNVNGVFLDTCTDVKCVNVKSGGHAGNGVAGFKINHVNGGIFEKCESLGNYAEDSTGTFTCAGFLVITSTGIVFNDCVSSGHKAKREAMGFLMANAIGCTFENCTSLRMTQSWIKNAEHPRFAGFYSMNGVGNQWRNCTSNQHWAGNAAVVDGDGAIGYYLSNESQSTLTKCVGNGSGARYNHAANAIGFYLDNTVGAIVDSTGGQTTGMAKGDCQYCVIRDCEASGNVTSGATATKTAYGFRDDSTDTRNIIINNMAMANTDNASPRITTNYWMDLPVGGQTSANWPLVSATMDGLSALNDRSTFFNVGITA
jgi:hypothetical protein